MWTRIYFVQFSLELGQHCNDQFGSQNKYVPSVLPYNFSQHMPFDDLNESTIVEMTEDSSEKSGDDDVSYTPSMNLEDHCYEEDMNEISDDNIICG